MTLKVNGEPQTVSGPRLTVAGLLALNQVEYAEMVSVQLNGKFIDRKLYADTELRENDEVDFLYFLGGGSRS